MALFLVALRLLLFLILARIQLQELSMTGQPPNSPSVSGTLQAGCLGRVKVSVSKERIGVALYAPATTHKHLF